MLAYLLSSPVQGLGGSSMQASPEGNAVLETVLQAGCSQPQQVVSTA